MTVNEPTSGGSEQQTNPWGAQPGVAAGAASELTRSYAQPPANGPLGKVRATGTCILLAVITFGIYSLVWFYKTHDEMKRHSGQGLGGGIALLIAIAFGVASPFITSSEVGELYQRRGQSKPVSGLTGLWYFPGAFIIVGPIVWFVKTNGALNAYWRSLGTG